MEPVLPVWLVRAICSASTVQMLSTTPSFFYALTACARVRLGKY